MTILLATALSLLLPSTHMIQESIRELAPQVNEATARRYARIIRREASKKAIDPFLVVAFIEVESSWNPRAKSPTNDYGLGQLHVAVNGSARFLGREEELFDPQTNIREWCRLADMWRSYHNRMKAKYAPSPEPHPWFSHLAWGYKVKNTEHADRVGVIYKRLKTRHLTPRARES